MKENYKLRFDLDSCVFEIHTNRISIKDSSGDVAEISHDDFSKILKKYKLFLEIKDIWHSKSGGEL